jgi:drug/metabolite transporter (DMT)-like permease
VNAAALVLVLGAAFLHAAWNALLKGGADRFRAIVIMSVASAAASVPGLIRLPTPDAASWPFILVSAAIHIAYNCALVRAYAHGDLGQVYPIARGSSPLLVTLSAAAIAGEWPTNLALAGIMLVSFGIFSLVKGWKQITSKTGIAAALLTGVLIASYTVVDGFGARASGSAFSYASWLFFLDGLPMALIYWYVRPKGAPLLTFDNATMKAGAGGIASLVAYATVIFAATLAPLGEVSALRETSVVFAALFGRLFLDETLSVARLGSCVAVAAGAICLAGWS